MSNYSVKATEPQIEAAAHIEQELLGLREMAIKSDLRFMAYLIEMAHDEAVVVAQGRRHPVETAPTLTHRD